MPQAGDKKDSYDGKRKALGLPLDVIYEPSFGGAAKAASATNGTRMDIRVPASAYAAPAINGARTDIRVPVSAYAAPAAGRRRADEIADGLAAILEQEALLYQDASDISSKKTDIIVHGKIEELDCLVKAEQAIILKIGKLEDERERVVQALSDELGVDLTGAVLSDINAHLGSDSYTRLGECQKSLADTLGGLKYSNDMNAQLIQNALDYVNFSVNTLTTNPDSGNTYSHDGGEEAGKARRSVFDVRL